MEEERKEMKKKANPYANALNLTGWLIIVIGLIGSFYLGDVIGIGWGYNYGVLLAGALISTCAGVLLLGLGEIINILDDSRNHIRKYIEANEKLVAALKEIPGTEEFVASELRTLEKVKSSM